MEVKLLKLGYRRFTQEDESVLFQKKISDYTGIKYFIDCYMYTINNKKRFEFKIQISTDYGTINTDLCDTILNIKEIERFMEDLWFYYGKNYYKKFVSQEEGGVEDGINDVVYTKGVENE